MSQPSRTIVIEIGSRVNRHHQHPNYALGGLYIYLCVCLCVCVHTQSTHTCM